MNVITRLETRASTKYLLNIITHWKKAILVNILITYLNSYEGKPKQLQNYDKRLDMEQHPFIFLINFFIAVL